MICPKDATQCTQYKGIGSGQSLENYYDTAELKECPKCKSVYLEFYTTFELDNDVESSVKNLKQSIKDLILQFIGKSTKK